MKVLFRYFALIIVAFGLSTMVTAQNEIPYIYYYSHALNGVVIERADGADSRIIGQGLVENQLSLVDGAGWSPNGQWFSWKMAWVGSGGTRVSRAYVVSANGLISLDFLKEFQCVHSMEWSPTGSHLLIRGTLQETHQVGCDFYPLPTATTWLIDMETQSVINTFSLESGLEYPVVLWDLDAEILYMRELRHPATPLYEILVTMPFDGSLEIEAFSESKWNTALHSTQNSEADDSPKDTNFPIDYNNQSPDGRYIWDVNGWLDTQSQQYITFAYNSSASNPYHLASYWHEDSQWVFLGYDYCFAGCTAIRRVNVFNPETGQSREISACGDAPACVNWLPEQVNSEDLLQGQPTSVLPTPESLDFSETYWAKNGHLGFLQDFATHQLTCNYTPYMPHQMTLVQDVTSGETVFELAEGRLCPDAILQGEVWIRPTENLVFTLSPDSRYAAITGETGYTSLYDGNTGEHIITLNFYGIELTFSDDSMQLITIGRYAVATWDVEQLVIQAAS